MLSLALPKRFPRIDFLVAAAPSSKSRRPSETLAPLAEALALILDERTADDDFTSLAARLLQQEEYDGRVIIICWHHGHIPQLALALGASLEDVASAPIVHNMRWVGDVFDRLWILDFRDGHLQFSTELEGAH
jgi:hypothetical protein